MNNFHLIAFHDKAGKIIGFVQVEGLAPVVVPYAFDSADAADQYRKQLESLHGIVRAQKIEGKHKRRAIRHIDTGNVYPSIAAASAGSGVSATGIANFLRTGNVKMHAVRGNRFEYVS